MSSHREVVPAALEGERIDRVVALITGASRSEVRTLIEMGVVSVNGEKAGRPADRVSEGDVVEFDYAGPPSHTPTPDATLALDIVHADEHLLVVNKAAGVVVHPGAGNEEGTLVSAVLARYPEIASVGEKHRPGVVHRLDKDTSGLLMIARTQMAYEALVDALSRREVARVYDVVACGEFEHSSGVVDAPIGRSPRRPTSMAVVPTGRPARTRYEVTSVFVAPLAAARLRCELETGRTHQIRVHLASIGHPVLGDERYGGRRSQLLVGRPFLHAARLRLTHPATGEALEFEAPLAPDLAHVLSVLR